MQQKKNRETVINFLWMSVKTEAGVRNTLKVHLIKFDYY